MDEVPSPTGLSREAMVVPIAAIGTLSQAWFDALGLARPKTPQSDAAPHSTGKSVARRPGQAVLPHQAESSSLSQSGEQILAKRVQPRKGRLTEHPRLISVEKLPRGWRVAEATGTANDTLRRSAGRVTIRSKHGVVRMLIQRDENRMRITAVCNPAIIGTISDALASAKLRLGARGISLNVSTHEENAA